MHIIIEYLTSYFKYSFFCLSPFISLPVLCILCTVLNFIVFVFFIMCILILFSDNINKRISTILLIIYFQFILKKVKLINNTTVYLLFTKIKILFRIIRIECLLRPYQIEHLLFPSRIENVILLRIEGLGLMEMK